MNCLSAFVVEERACRSNANTKNFLNQPETEYTNIKETNKSLKMYYVINTSFLFVAKIFAGKSYVKSQHE